MASVNPSYTQAHITICRTRIPQVHKGTECQPYLYNTSYTRPQRHRVPTLFVEHVLHKTTKAQSVVPICRTLVLDDTILVHRIVQKNY